MSTARALILPLGDVLCLRSLRDSGSPSRVDLSITEDDDEDGWMMEGSEGTLGSELCGNAPSAVVIAAADATPFELVFRADSSNDGRRL